MSQVALPVDPAAYRRHPIHGEHRTWGETNCYVDLWVELLHAWGAEPVAALPFTVAADFEGDQWTFFKFPYADLEALYGLDVQELALYRPLVDHVAEQLGRGRPVLVEVDSFYLPDTAGTAYRRAHVKTTIGAVAVDVAGRRLGYFHNAGYFELSGDDFAGALRLDVPADSPLLPPYAEFVKGRPVQRGGAGLAEASLRLLARHLRRVPEANPFLRFRERLEADLPGLAAGPLDAFHQYAFATLRQVGACFELTGTYLGWLQDQLGLPAGPAAERFGAIAMTAKVVQFNLARALARKKPLDLGPVGQMAEDWRAGVEAVRSLVG